MHWCFLSEHFHKDPSGPRTACLGLARGMTDLGHDVSLISMSRHDDRQRLPGGGEARLVRYGWRLLPVNFGRPRYFARELARLHHQRPVDVVLAMGMEAATAAHRFAEAFGVPWVLNPRSCSKDKPGGWRNMRARRLFDACHGFVALSEAAADDWAANLDRPRDSKLVSALNGCDIAVLEGPCEAPPGLAANGPPLVLSMGSLRGNKGHHWLARALAGLRHMDWRWVIAGDGMARSGLASLVGELGLAQRTIFTGVVRGAQWRWLFRHATVFSLFPVYPEACGNVFLEAQAAGLPVVASNAGALPEVTRPGETSLLVDVRGDALADEPTVLAALQDPLMRVLGDENLRARMALAGRQYAATLDWRGCARKYLAAVGIELTV